MFQLKSTVKRNIQMIKIIIKHLINLIEDKTKKSETEYTRLTETERIMNMDAVL